MIVLADQSVVGVNEVHPGRAARVLAAAFEDDPLMRFAFPSRRQRMHGTQWLFRRSVEYGCRYGQVLSTPHAEAVAIWLGPVGTKLTLMRELRTGMIIAPFRLGIRSLLRLGAFDRVRNQLHEQCVAEPHAYLFVMGVHPAAQGRGLGSRVIRPMLERADRQGLVCYLETTNERNLPYFGRFGFEPVLHERIAASDGHRLNIWALLRQPRVMADRMRNQEPQPN